MQALYLNIGDCLRVKELSVTGINIVGKKPFILLFYLHKTVEHRSVIRIFFKLSETFQIIEPPVAAQKLSDKQ